jgi:TolA-binding protein
MEFPGENVEISRKELENAIQIIRNNKVKEGMEMLSRIALTQPNCDFADDALYYMGLVYLKYNKKPRAYNCFYKLVKEYPDSNVFKYARCYLDSLKNEQDPAAELFFDLENNFRQKRFERCLELSRQLLDKYPDSNLADNALLYEGLVWQNRGRLESKPDYEKKAADIFSELLKRYPDSDAAAFIRNN